MRTPPRAPVSGPVIVTTPRTEVSLSGEDLAAAAGISRTRLARLVRLGLVEPDTAEASRFTAGTVGRLRLMLRLHRDLGVNFTGAAIIVELLERLERLEADLARWRGSSQGPTEGFRQP
jgi:chaperone modulatory protein CbpM